MNKNEVSRVRAKTQPFIDFLSTVADLLYWKDTRTSGAVFTGLMASLLCLLHFSIVSVAAHLALLGLCATISLRVYRKVLQAVHRGDGTNPFQ